MPAKLACVSRDRTPLRCYGRDASSSVGAPVDARHCPERILLYPLFQEKSPALKAYLSAQGTRLPGYVGQAFEDDRKCGWLEPGILWVRCETCHAERLVVAPSLSAG